jgi:hypothetical protein
MRVSSDDGLMRITTAFKSSALRIPESDTPSPNGTPSSGTSPSISPHTSPRGRAALAGSSSRMRYLLKSAELLESGDREAWKTNLLDSRLSVVGALFDVVPEDQWSALAESLVIVFEQNRKSIRLMIWALRKEVAGTLHEHDMFRLDSAASKLMGSYGQLVAGSFIKVFLFLEFSLFLVFAQYTPNERIC